MISIPFPIYSAVAIVLCLGFIIHFHNTYDSSR